jgi:tRNA threonylcarbamoyladenosine biosynthesis protein TsaE
MDAYRLDSALEAEQLDLDAMLSQGPLIVEWPERMMELVPPERLWVHLEQTGAEQRAMTFHASGSRYEELLDVIRKAADGGN